LAVTFYHLWAHSFKLLKVIPYGEPKDKKGDVDWPGAEEKEISELQDGQSTDYRIPILSTS